MAAGAKKAEKPENTAFVPLVSISVNPFFSDSSILFSILFNLFFLFLRVLRCFTSPGALCPAYLIQPGVTGHYPSRVPPFGDLRIIAYLRLPEAFRSLSRPSSAISALASTLRSCSLDLASSIA